MKKLLASILLSLTFVVGAQATDLTPQEQFIGRFYQNILGRSADGEGMNTWLNVIQNQSATQVAIGFFNSQEFTNLGLSNDAFVDILYRTLFDREPDAGGKAGWMAQLEGNISREMVGFGFLGSQEFKNLAERFGVPAILDTDVPTSSGVEQYVNRFYSIVLDRGADSAGFIDWVSQLKNRTKAGGDIAKGFFNSQEYVGRGLDDSNFLDLCYRAFFDREADAGGKSDWALKLTQGFTKDEVLDGFIGSQEFINLAARYGIDSGVVNSTSYDYTGTWNGTSRVVLTQYPSVYCNWNLSVLIHANDTASISAVLTSHNGDDGDCDSFSAVAGSISNKSNNGFTFDVGYTTSDNIYGGNTFNFSGNDSRVSEAINTSVDGYSAVRETSISKN